MKEKVEHFFGSFPEANEVYATSNEVLFMEKHHAQAYANEQLDDKTVATISRLAKEELKEELEEMKEELKEEPEEEAKEEAKEKPEEEPKEELEEAKEEEKAKAGKKNKSK